MEKEDQDRDADTSFLGLRRESKKKGLVTLSSLLRMPSSISHGAVFWDYLFNPPRSNAEWVVQYGSPKVKLLQSV